MKIQRNSNSNQFCVPAALAALTGLHTDECEKLLKEELGDIKITGVFYPIILKILGKLGYQYKEVSRSNAKNFSEGRQFLICMSGHVGVIEGKTYYDNGYLNGVELESGGKHRRLRIQQIFEVWK